MNNQVGDMLAQVHIFLQIMLWISSKNQNHYKRLRYSFCMSKLYTVTDNAHWAL